jgi:glycosyltransferase involved in cell wall biosynthesis
MKIVFLVTDLFNNIGGIQVFNNHLIKALIELGHTVSVVSINDSRRPGDINCLFSPSAKYIHFKKPIFIIHTLKQISSFKPDLIICGHVNFSLLCRALTTVFNIPYFTITHGIEAWNLSRLKILGLRHSKKILSVSNFTKSKILEQLPDYPEKNIIILANAVDTQRFRPEEKPKYLMNKFNLKNEDKIILTIARLSKRERYKGYDKVIIAMKEVIEEIPNARYILGGFGDDMERIKRSIKDNDLDASVVFAGFIPPAETADYYNLCDVFVMPSFGEGFGIVFLEALACGKPVIAGNKDGSRDALLNGQLGMLVDPFDAHGIAVTICKVLNREVSQDLLDVGYLSQKTRELFGLERFTQRVKEIFEGAVL